MTTLLRDLHRPVRTTLLRDVPYLNKKITDLVHDPWYALQANLGSPLSSISDLIFLI